MATGRDGETSTLFLLGWFLFPLCGFSVADENKDSKRGVDLGDCHLKRPAAQVVLILKHISNR